jgi:sec-independent protein translocase protein TatA
MGSIGFPELILIFIIVLLIFGGKKIPELAKGLGEGIRSFRESLHGQSPQDEKKDKPQ